MGGGRRDMGSEGGRQAGMKGQRDVVRVEARERGKLVSEKEAGDNEGNNVTMAIGIRT